MSKNFSNQFEDLDGVKTYIIYFNDGRPERKVYTRALAESYCYGPMKRLISKVTTVDGMPVNLSIGFGDTNV